MINGGDLASSPQPPVGSVVFYVDGAGRAQILGFAGAVLVGRVGGVGVQKFDESTIIAVTEDVRCGLRTLLGSDTGFVGDNDLQRGSYDGWIGGCFVGASTTILADQRAGEGIPIE